MNDTPALLYSGISTQVWPEFSPPRRCLRSGLHGDAQPSRHPPTSSLRKVWPEFGCCGKEQITVRDVLEHKAGLAEWLPSERDDYDGGGELGGGAAARSAAAGAAAPPAWTPKTLCEVM